MSTPAVDEAARHEAATRAEAEAAEVAGRAGVVVREQTEVADLRALVTLLDAVWGPTPATPPMTTEILRALSKSGNYVVAASDGRGILGACVGFFAEPRSLSMHSHIAAVAPRGRGRGVGHALKQHQRAWALTRGVEHVSWTFDPLVRRNAYFNIAKLSAMPVDYLPDFYGEMDDTINRGDASDRLLVSWDLTVPVGAPPRVTDDDVTGRVVLGRAPDGAPQLPATGTADPGDAPVLRVAVPPDIERLRHDDPGQARAWRSALREVLGGLMGQGMRVTGFDRAGWYELRRDDVESADPHGQGSHQKESR